MKLFRTFARGFCKKSKFSESPSQYSKILQKDFAGKYVTGQPNEIFVRGEGLDGGVNFENASQKYFDYIQDVQDDKIGEIEMFESSWIALMNEYAQVRASPEMEDYMRAIGEMAHSCNLSWDSASGIIALLWTLVQVAHREPQLLKPIFDKNTNLFDKNFEEKFDNFLEKSKKIKQLDDEIHELGLHLLNKLGDLAHFEFILPAQCPNDIVSIFKHIEYFSYKLPVLLNKQWLTYCLGYRCLEMIFQNEENEIRYDKRLISSLDPDSVELSRDLDSLHDKFVSIENIVITPRMNKNEETNENSGSILKTIASKATTLREEIENDAFLSQEQKKNHNKIILEAQSLLKMHYMIESVNDTFDINFENIFTLRDISLLESGYYEAFEQCHRNLQLMELESDASDEACSKRNVGPHGWLMVKFERILKALYGND